MKLCPALTIENINWLEPMFMEYLDTLTKDQLEGIGKKIKTNDVEIGAFINEALGIATDIDYVFKNLGVHPDPYGCNPDCITGKGRHTHFIGKKASSE